ncbi:hypothetical protein [Bradyrhizobium sp. CCBAU 21360]|uniref:hypothetical protein n=1 Tax=Bradyrhizobium sp. CCBAU 21360 TaxID=1325081 RepID=UPI002305F284|nr:hypothetical protein [Bradyrhizobium sp. CCBAU 21360]
MSAKEEAATTTGELREDEQFVMTSIARNFSATWRPGENPPDAYLTFDAGSVAVEITTLTQHVTDDRGTRPRLSDDSATGDFADALNDELGHLIPDGFTIGLVLSSPILELRKTRARLAQIIRAHIANFKSLESDQTIQINGNSITIGLTHHEDTQYKKVSAVFMNRNSSANILVNATQILEDRITTKARKCAHLLDRDPVWLALLNDYWLAEPDTYRVALSRLTIQHPFERILLVSGDGSVHLLYVAPEERADLRS